MRCPGSNSISGGMSLEMVGEAGSLQRGTGRRDWEKSGNMEGAFSKMRLTDN